MIKYNLKCHNNHEFESWFSESSEFDKLNKRKLLECIFCSSTKIQKSIMSPMVSSKKNAITFLDHKNKELLSEKKNLIKLRKFVEKNFEFVGDNFSKEIRNIYYEKKNKKSIYGTTTKKEREELADEGIDLLSVPWVNKDN